MPRRLGSDRPSKRVQSKVPEHMLAYVPVCPSHAPDGGGTSRATSSSWALVPAWSGDGTLGRNHELGQGEYGTKIRNTAAVAPLESSGLGRLDKCCSVQRATRVFAA